MNAAFAKRNATWPSIFLAVITLVTITLAPVCAPLCAAKACVNAALTTESGCHHDKKMSAESSPFWMASLPLCALGELPVATLDSKRTDDSPVLYQSFLVTATHSSAPHFFSISGKFYFSIAENGPPFDKNGHSFVAVLRI